MACSWHIISVCRLTALGTKSEQQWVVWWFFSHPCSKTAELWDIFCFKKQKKGGVPVIPNIKLTLRKYCVNFMWQKDDSDYSGCWLSVVQYRWLWPGLVQKTICFLFTFAGHQNNSLDGRMHHSSLIICIHQRENAWTWYSGMFLWFPGSVKLSLFSTFSFGPLPFNSAR